jgi:CO/xanthine dehydrogenase Mo-binding subunit
MAAAPDVHVRILESPDERYGGTGELAVPVAAPALCGALHAATRSWVGELPVAPFAG